MSLSDYPIPFQKENLNCMKHKISSGFTLMELLVTIAIVSIVASVAVPNFRDMVDKGNVAGATDQLYQNLTYARSEAIKLNSPVTLSFTESSSWCSGLSDGGVCDCGTTNSCQIDGIDRSSSYNNYNNTSLSVSTALKNANFNPTRGILEKAGVPSTGSITITNSDDSTISATISMNLLGRPSVCSDSISKFPDCT